MHVGIMANDSNLPVSADAAPRTDRFRSTPQILPLPEGLYLVSVKPGRQAAVTVHGVSFPAVQLSSVPQPGTRPLKFLKREDVESSVWLTAGEQVVMIAPAGPAPLLLTNYLYGPELQQAVDLNIQKLNNVAPPATVGLRLYAHIQQIGEQQGAAGEWVMAEDAPYWIESVRMEVTAAVGQLLQYRVPGVTGSDGNWTPAPGQIGTPGGRPLSGIAFRLMAPLASTHKVIYAARFLRHGEIEAADGEPCRSPQPQDPLIALRVAIVPR